MHTGEKTMPTIIAKWVTRREAKQVQIQYMDAGIDAGENRIAWIARVDFGKCNTGRHAWIVFGK